MKSELIKNLMKKSNLKKIVEDYDIFDDDMETYDIPEDDLDYTSWDDFEDEEAEEESEEEIFVNKDPKSDLEVEADRLLAKYDTENTATDSEFTINRSNENTPYPKFELNENWTIKQISDKILGQAIRKNPTRFSQSTISRLSEEGFNLKIGKEDIIGLENYMNEIEGDADRLEMPRESQMKIFNDARSGNKYACYYLYARYLRLTTKVYNEFFVYPASRILYWVPVGAIDSIENARTISGIAWSCISNDNRNLKRKKNGDFKKDFVSPYDKMNFDLYSDDTNILDKGFSGEYFRYLQSRVNSYTTEFISNVLHGSIRIDDLTQNSHWEPFIDESDKINNNLFYQNDVLPVYEEIYDWAEKQSQGKTHRYYGNIWKYKMLDGLSNLEMGKKLGFDPAIYSNVEIENKANRYFKNFMDYFKKNNPELYFKLKDLKDSSK